MKMKNSRPGRSSYGSMSAMQALPQTLAARDAGELPSPGRFVYNHAGERALHRTSGVPHQYHVIPGIGRLYVRHPQHGVGCRSQELLIVSPLKKERSRSLDLHVELEFGPGSDRKAAWRLRDVRRARSGFIMSSNNDPVEEAIRPQGHTRREQFAGTCQGQGRYPHRTPGGVGQRLLPEQGSKPVNFMQNPAGFAPRFDPADEVAVAVRLKYRRQCGPGLAPGNPLELARGIELESDDFELARMTEAHPSHAHITGTIQADGRRYVGVADRLEPLAGIP
jgi:hypothetical protein